ncbi:uncharacterized protein J3D65DRAFT_102086 [Phyllosticta citribraziliensis]|uniref:Uncharacterized protein n=1 Tax=Phyllosticta citribraziliensis TaxID=989973 RepID=A0ABR1LF59_9PEZI
MRFFYHFRRPCRRQPRGHRGVLQCVTNQPTASRRTIPRVPPHTFPQLHHSTYNAAQRHTPTHCPICPPVHHQPSEQTSHYLTSMQLKQEKRQQQQGPNRQYRHSGTTRLHAQRRSPASPYLPRCSALASRVHTYIHTFLAVTLSDDWPPCLASCFPAWCFNRSFLFLLFYLVELTRSWARDHGWGRAVSGVLIGGGCGAWYCFLGVVWG